MLLTITDAAHAAGVARSTIYDKIKAGELTRNADKLVDTMDLLRVFGTLQTPSDGEGTPEPKDGSTTAPAGSDAAWLRELVEAQTATIERLHGQLATAADRLHEADERAERRDDAWRAQLTALLPAPADSKPAPRGFFRRVFG